MRIGETGHQIRRARSRRCDADAYLAGGASVSIGGQRSPLFESNKNVMETGRRERVIEWDDGSAGIAEDNINPFCLESATGDLAPG